MDKKSPKLPLRTPISTAKSQGSPLKAPISPTKLTSANKNPQPISQTIKNPTQNSPKLEKPKQQISPTKVPVSKEIHTDSSDDDIIEDLSIENKIKQLSPTKYFSKRTSFDYQKLKSIEKPMRRASAIEGLNNLKISSNIDKALLVKFSTITEEIKTEEKTETKNAFKNDKPRRSILKNTYIEEELVLTKIFDKNSLNDLIEKIDKASGGNQKLYNEILPKIFLEFWRNNENNPKKSLLILKGINLEYLRLVFKEGIENKIVLAICNIFKTLCIEESEFIMEFLEHFTKVRRFKFSLACLNAKESNEIKSLFIELQKNKKVDKKKLEELIKLYEV